jgi:hypothetical protein
MHQVSRPICFSIILPGKSLAHAAATRQIKLSNRVRCIAAQNIHAKSIRAVQDGYVNIKVTYEIERETAWNPKNLFTCSFFDYPIIRKWL